MLIIGVLFGCATTVCMAQAALLKQGDRYFNDLSYAQAAEAYEHAFRKNASSIPHARRLAECYWNLRDTKKALTWYALVATSSQAIPEDLYRYSELLRIDRQYSNSDVWLRRYGKLMPNDSRVELKEDATEKLGALLSEPGIAHKVTPVSFNSDKADMAPFIHKNTIYFSSSRTDQFTSRHTDSWNDQPFLNLYIGKISDDGTVSDVKPMGDGINSQYHESNVVISDDGSELYFTRNNYKEGRKVLGEDGVNNLQIFVRRLLPEGWSKETAFPYNSPSYSVGHPAITKDGQRLFFTSDMPGGVGGKDLYVCQRDAHGSWGEPENLGKPINTEGDEMFSYVFGNTLYFASDGHLGLGGLDLFSATLRGNGFGTVENLNMPINGNGDDFGFCLDQRGEIGFITSDRDGHLGSEDIYTFQMNSKAEDDRKWAGRILDVSDAQPIPYLTVRLLDAERNEIGRTITTALGNYEFPSPEGTPYVNVSIDGGPEAELSPNDIALSPHGDTELPDIYMNSVMDLHMNVIVFDGSSKNWLDGVSVTVKSAKDGTILFIGTTNEEGITRGEMPDRRYASEQDLDIVLAKSGYFSKTIRVDFRLLSFNEQPLTSARGVSMTPLSLGVDIAKAMNLEPITFDYHESLILPSTAAELDQVTRMMLANPSIRIDLRTHTDSQDGIEYNDELSRKQASNCRNYLIKQGVDGDRIAAYGMGQRDPVNQCGDGVACTDEQHRMNRRTEFIVTGCMDCAMAGTVK